jgi:hypothetical protein
MDETQRFWSKVSVGDCWVWTAATKFDGYGLFRAAGGKQVFAHRWSYENLVGAIPGKLTVDHLCRVRACVNPDHMELVPMGVNIRRGYSPPAMNARRTQCDEGHEFDRGTKQRFCRTCRNRYLREYREAKRRREGLPIGKGAHQKSKTHCVNGHPFDETNTYLTPEGYRKCRTCIRTALRESKRKKREADRAKRASQSG